MEPNVERGAVIVECQCGKKNRLPDDLKPDARYLCGQCGADLHIVMGSYSLQDEISERPEHVRAQATNKGASKAPAIICTIFLFVAVLGRWPSGFYTLLRFAVCGSAIYLAVQASALRKPAWLWIMGAMAVLFNPLVPIRFPRHVWHVLDFIAATTFLVSLAAFRKRNA